MSDDGPDPMIPGEVRVRETPLTINADKERRTLVVVNDGDRPIQVGAHLHFPDANPALNFDRESVHGFRLDAPAGTSVRFEPGVSRVVELVALGGTRHVPGLQVRDPRTSLPTHAREPKRVVPFGTPGAEPKTPATASPPARARVSDTTPDGTEGNPQPDGEEGQ